MRKTDREIKVTVGKKKLLEIMHRESEIGIGYRGPKWTQLMLYLVIPLEGGKKKPFENL